MTDAPEDPDKLLDQWSTDNAEALKRWHSVLNELKGDAGGEFAIYAVATRELLGLAQSD